MMAVSLFGGLLSLTYLVGLALSEQFQMDFRTFIYPLLPSKGDTWRAIQCLQARWGTTHSVDSSETPR